MKTKSTKKKELTKIYPIFFDHIKVISLKESKTRKNSNTFYKVTNPRLELFYKPAVKL